MLGNNFNIDVKYEYNDHNHDEYGHDANAYFKVTFADKEYLEINYTEAQGERQKADIVQLLIAILMV